MKLLDELKRRKVFKVSVAYLALSWLLVQVAETLLPAYGFTDAAMRTLVAILAVGLVAVLIFAWVFDWTPRGLRVTPPAGAASEIASTTSHSALNAVIAIIVIVAAIIAGILTFRTVDDGPPSNRSIAVMPFATLGQPTSDVFTDGIHVGVITRLSNVADLEVISRTSVLALRDLNLSLPQVAAKLGAAWILNADIQQAGKKVLVSVRLADARADRQVWAQNYQRTLTATNVFEIQTEVANRIIEEVNAHLARSEKDRLERLPTGDLEAYRLYQHGRALLEQRTGSAMRNSLDYFERALELDSKYAPAWSGLANGMVLLVAYEHDTDPTLVERAELATTRALALDPELADAWVASGLLSYLRRDTPGAIQALDRAIEYRPSDANAHSQRAFQQALLGRSDLAYRDASKAGRLNPLSPEVLAVLSGSAIAVGRIDEGLEAAQRSVELAPEWPNARFALGTALLRSGEHADAIEQLDGITVPWTGAGAETVLMEALLAVGDDSEARALIPIIQSSGDVYSEAVSQALLGNLDEGYRTLLEIEVWGDFQSIAFQSHHRILWQPQGFDPRYEQVLRRVHANWGVKGSATP